MHRLKRLLSIKKTRHYRKAKLTYSPTAWQLYQLSTKEYVTELNASKEKFFLLISYQSFSLTIVNSFKICPRQTQLQLLEAI